MEKTICMTTDFLSRAMEGRMKWHITFLMLKEKICQPRNSYLVKIFFRIEETIKALQDERKLTDLVTSRPTL